MFLIDDIVNAIGGAIAGGQQENQAQKAIDLQNQIYGQNSQNYQPFISGGRQTLAQLLAGLQSGAFNPNVTPQTIANDPGYQFRMQQAQQALERSAAASGNLNSGAFMKGLDQYSQGLASQEYNNAWQRQFQAGQANYGNLAGIAGLGFNAANNLGALGQNYANSMASLYGAKGNAQAAGTMAVTNGISGGIKDIGNALGGNNGQGPPILFGGGGGGGGGGVGGGGAGGLMGLIGSFF